MNARVALTALATATALTLTGCGSDKEPSAKPSAAPSAPSSSAAATTTASATTPVVRTPELDAIGALGHSGATGADSEGTGLDVLENSWATGTNPKVDSIYLRLLADHPELEGHAWNEAISGSDVTSLMDQAELLLQHDPVPDLVLVNSVDNDIVCDGSDEKYYDGFAGQLDEVLTYLEQTAPGIRVFFVDQWTSVTAYDDVVAAMPGGVEHLMDDGPCGTFTSEGKRNPQGEKYLQRQVDEYFQRIVDVCARHPDCATDEAAMQAFPLEPADLSADMNHLTAVGLAKEAAIAWEALPAEWK